MDSEGTSVRRLGPGVATGVSPAGTEVAFYGSQGQLCIGAVNGAPSRTLRWRLPGSAIAANTHADTPWSPDGSHLIVMRSDPTSDSPHNDVFTVDTSTGYFIRITPSSTGVFDGAAWSGDSRQVAISGPTGLVVINNDGTQARTLEKRPIDRQLLQWAPLTGHIYARVHNVGDFLLPTNGDDPSLLANPDHEYDWRADRSAAVKPYKTNADLEVRHPDGTHDSAWSGGAPPGVVYGAYEPRWAFDDNRFFYRAESTQPTGQRAQSIAYLLEDASGGKVLFTISAETGLAFRAPMPADRAAVVVTSIV